MTIWIATAEAEEKQRELAQTILGALAEEIHLTDERYLGTATALSGSAPGCVFLLIEALVDAGVHIGLPLDMAQEKGI